MIGTLLFIGAGFAGIVVDLRLLSSWSRAIDDAFREQQSDFTQHRSELNGPWATIRDATWVHEIRLFERANPGVYLRWQDN